MALLAEVTPRLFYSEFGNNLIVKPAEDEDPEVLFERVCSKFENQKIEQDSEGNIYIMAPVGGESSDQNSELTMQLRAWAKQDGRGRAFDSSVEFILPDLSKRSPDGSWVRNEKLAALSRNERRKFLKLVPDFVVELKSPSDRFSDLQKKMQDWRRNGVELGWLIHPDQRVVLIFRQSADEPETYRGNELHADGPVAGFTLQLEPIWEGLNF